MNHERTPVKAGRSDAEERREDLLPFRREPREARRLKLLHAAKCLTGSVLQFSRVPIISASSYRSIPGWTRSRKMWEFPRPDPAALLDILDGDP